MTRIIGTEQPRYVTPPATTIRSNPSRDPSGKGSGVRERGRRRSASPKTTAGNGLVQIRARYYNPALSVFTELDRVETVDGYHYLEENPANFGDRSGIIGELPP
ncbi:MAG: hypothetical protein IT324_08050 [Anaerolineae bacterium]|nr:hypothetical protein [Anaerolineae bacterium]